MLQSGTVGEVLGEPMSVEVAELAGYVTIAHGAVRNGRVEETGAGAMPVPGIIDTEEAARVMAHPASLLAVPANSGLGSGVAGLVVRARALGPTWVVDLAVGGRIIEARWEWDLTPPPVGIRLALNARPGTLRVFGTSIAELPDPPPAPRIATSTPAASPEPSPWAAPSPPAAAAPQQEAPASALPPTRGATRIASPATGVEQRHRQMPLN